MSALMTEGAVIPVCPGEWTKGSSAYCSRLMQAVRMQAARYLFS